MMERTALLKHLEAARRHVLRGEDQIARQKRILADLIASHADTSFAERLLEAFEETHSRHLIDMQRILNDLDGA